MERPAPMDRLLCGDVGVTERRRSPCSVVMKVRHGRKAGRYSGPHHCPGRQHFLTALRRFAKYPVNIDVVSRFPHLPPR